MKKVITFAIAILMLVPMLCGCWNYQMFDTTFTFDYAYISLPNDECVEGEVQKWRDYEDGDQIQVTINGITYLTDTTRAVLVSK